MNNESGIRRRALLAVVAACATAGLAVGGEPAAPGLGRPPAIHVAKGLWWHLLRLREAAGLAGGAVFSDSFDVVGSPHGYHGCGSPLAGFPRTAEELNAYDVIVLAGCRISTIPAPAQELLCTWVRQGGGLLVAGGVQSLDQDHLAGAPLLAILPVTIEPTPGLLPLKDDNVVTPTAEGRLLFTGVTGWEQQPRVHWLHGGVRPRDGATVLLTAGTRPLGVSATVGKGRVVVWTATVCGEAGAGETSFWDWRDWPRVLAHLLAWVTPATREARTPLARSVDANEKAGRERLKAIAQSELGDPLAEEGETPTVAPGPPVGAEVTKLAAACRDAAYADLVIRALAESGSKLTVGEAQVVFGAIAPYVQAGPATAAAQQLVGVRDPGLIALGLRLLGALKVPNSSPVLLKYAARGLDAISREDPGEGLPAFGVRAPDGRDEAVRLAAALGLLDLGDVAAAPKLRPLWEAWRQRTADPEALAQARRDLEEAMLAALAALGDAEAAVLVVDRLAANRLQAEHTIDVMERPMLGVPSPEMLAELRRAQESLPYLRRRNQLLYRALRQCPLSSLAALCRRPEHWQGVFAEEALLAGLAVRPATPPPAEVAQALAKMRDGCGLPSVRLLCQAWLGPGAPAAGTGPAAGPATPR